MCPKHLKDEILETTMVQHGWKRCPKCYVVVEMNMGCKNIRYVADMYVFNRLRGLRLTSA